MTWSTRVRCWRAVVGGLATAGCVGKSVHGWYAPDLPVTSLADITASPPAAIMAVGGTVQLTFTGRDYLKAPIATFDSVYYQYQTATDSSRVKISTTGLLTGVQSTGTGTVLVNVIAFKGADIHGDVVVTQVTPTVIPGLTFSVQPVAPDSARLANGTTKTIVPVLKNPTTGVLITNPAVKYTEYGSDSTRLDVYRGKIVLNGYDARLVATQIITRETNDSKGLSPNSVSALNVGTAWIYATVNVYGTVMRDSVMYTMTYPFTHSVSTSKTNLTMGTSDLNQITTLAPGAIVTFSNSVATGDPMTMNYTFDNPAGATIAPPVTGFGGDAGNIVGLIAGKTSRRQLLTPGTYKWTVLAVGGPAPWAGWSGSATIVIK